MDKYYHFKREWYEAIKSLPNKEFTCVMREISNYAFSSDKHLKIMRKDDSAIWSIINKYLRNGQE